MASLTATATTSATATTDSMEEAARLSDLEVRKRQIADARRRRKAAEAAAASNHPSGLVLPVLSLASASVSSSSSATSASASASISSASAARVSVPPRSSSTATSTSITATTTTTTNDFVDLTNSDDDPPPSTSADPDSNSEDNNDNNNDDDDDVVIVSTRRVPGHIHQINRVPDSRAIVFRAIADFVGAQSLPSLLNRVSVPQQQHHNHHHHHHQQHSRYAPYPPKKQIVPEPVPEPTTPGIVKCTICQCTAEADTPLVSTKCGHIFCEECINNSIKSAIGKQCPNCKTKMTGKDNGLRRLYI
ncbi:hypothetical protein BCR33DRAFT_720070 [Rhizoclosmatium globosum]|uniref:RING-type domain-containing protein n=1 Tax=Rhizoclosmatium globosum TaxID=329046 RepID=A0A1Y2BXX3_9FUNG|nr:hypothetical protein BCR33DRAFT_720070 [Rhizoclosmatium globosum]|eukprot:ORY39620.1 hypothetical protein BCR33DRAFT_720070 [Rhizoclosmatium globosum]